MKIPSYAGNTATVAGNQTIYPLLGDGWQTQTLTTEGQGQVNAQVSGTLSNLYLTVFLNTVAATTTLNLRLGGVSGNQTLSVGSLATGEFQDSTHSDQQFLTKPVNFQLIVGDIAGHAFGSSTIGCCFTDASGNTTQTYLIHAPGPGTTASLVYYNNWNGHQSANQNTETAALQMRSRVAGTWDFFTVNLSSNTRTSTTTWKNRLNGADGAMNMAVGSGATGQFTDSSHSNLVNLGDLMNSSVTTGTGSGAIASAGCYNITTTDGTCHLAMSGRETTIFTYAASNTYYGLIQGSEVNENTVASEGFEVQQLINVSCTVSGYEVYISANSVTGSSTVNFRVNGVNGNGTMLVGSNATGWFSDDSHEDTLPPSAEVNWQFVIGAGGTSLTLAMTGLRIGGLTNPVPKTYAFLTSSSGNFSAQTDGTNITVESVAQGGGGRTADVSGAGTGGGGGAYTIINVAYTPGASIPYTNGTGGAANTSGTDSTWNTNVLVAKAGTTGASGVAGVGGAAASCTPSTGAFSGGAGGGLGTAHGAGGGGGGAGGPYGAGKAGASENASSAPSGGSGGGGADGGPSNATAGVSGSQTGLGGAGGVAQDGTAGGVGGTSGSHSGGGGSNGSGGGGGFGVTNSTAGVGGNGGNGNEWAAGKGAGGGGGGGGVSSSGGTGGNGGSGGSYGGGGGGGGFASGTKGTGGAPGSGLIVITYTPPITSLQPMVFSVRQAVKRGSSY